MKGFTLAYDIPPGRAAPGTSAFDPKARFNAGFWAGALSEAKGEQTEFQHRASRARLAFRLEDPFFLNGYLSGESFQAMGEITASGSLPAWQEFLIDLQDPELINLLDVQE